MGKAMRDVGKLFERHDLSNKDLASQSVFLVVEDDPDVREALSRSLKEIYNKKSREVTVVCASSLQEALSKRNELRESNNHVELVLLDLWLPDGDGIDAIQIFKEHFKDKVVVISAQGDADTIVKCLRRGAEDFIEKPVNVAKIENIVNREKRILSNERELEAGVSCKPSPKPTTKTLKKPGMTLKQPVMFMGIGIHSGKKFGVRIEPAESGGIQFSPLGSDILVPVSAWLAEPGILCSVINVSGFVVKTVEHLLSALWGLGISHCILKVSHEIPILDGSALEFVRAIKRVGLKPADEVETIVIDEPFSFDFGDGKIIEVTPHEGFEVRYLLEINGEQMVAAYSKDSDYERDLASARTFSFLKDVALAHAQDLAQGGRFNNFVLLDGTKAINTTLRYNNEPARHKVLDLIGDLYTTGYSWLCRIQAQRTGHRENIHLAKALSERYLCNPWRNTQVVQ